jgi:hypothetical protein
MPYQGVIALVAPYCFARDVAAGGLDGAAGRMSKPAQEHAMSSGRAPGCIGAKR